MKEINYKEIESLVNESIVALSDYVDAFENGNPSASILRTSKVLEKLKFCIVNNESFPDYLLRGVKDISVAAAKEYEGTVLSDCIISIRRFFMSNVNSFDSLEPLRMKFDEYF